MCMSKKINALFLICVICCLGSNSFFAQGTLSGMVTDTKGNPVVGVILKATSTKEVFAMTDFDGLYKLLLPSDEKYYILLTYIGFEDLEDSVQLKNNQILKKDFVMVDKTLETQEVRIVGRAVKSTDNYMERIKMNSATNLDYISSETIKKTGDASVINAIARVSGVSTSGGLITVRGIGDRYVRTTLNGSRIPTLDPLTNNIKLDIFPNSLVDNIVLMKTYSPELPGDWAGAYVSVETKDFPDRLTVQFDSQIGYNQQTTFKSIISSDRSSTDWLGYDDGLRKRDNNQVVSPNLNPTTYDEMVSLGLSEYYNSMGIYGWSDGSAQANLYFRLGLVQLGILAPAQIDDSNAISSATDVYNSTYRPQAHGRINPDNKDYNNGFKNNWDVTRRVAPLNQSYSFSIGNNINFFKRELGFMVGLRYNSSNRFDPNGVSQRVGDESLGYLFEIQDNAQISRETNSWSALLSGTLKLNEHNKFNFLFMPNFIGNNDVVQFTSVRLPEEYQDIDISKNIFYEQRKQLIYQFGGTHYLPAKKIKVDYSASYTDGSSLAPDFKTTQYLYVLRGDSIESYQFSPTAGDGIRRYYRSLKETALECKLNIEMPVFEANNLTRKIKFGANVFRNYRKIDNDEYRIMPGNNVLLAPITDGDINNYLSPEHFVMHDGIIDYTYSNFPYDRNHSFGNSNVSSLYGQADYELNKRMRLFGGIRAEYTDIFTDVDRYYQKGYEKYDPRRANLGGFPSVNAASINSLHLLPSLNLIRKIVSKNNTLTNFKFSFSRNLARPSIRELSDAAIYDNEFRTLVYGNSDLKIVRITNYDLRLEKYFEKGDNVSFSAFYKDFRNHIEMGFGSSGITWENIAKSSVRGIEVEGTKTIVRGLELKANVTLVKSIAEFVRRDFQVVEGRKVYSIIDTLERPMFGQAPYIINGILSYKSDSLGFAITASYNVQGPRLVIAGAVKGRADVYELPRNTIDIKISKKIGKYFTASFIIRDLLNAPVRRSYDLPSGWVDFDKFRYGTNYLLGLGYKF
jgi:hypothetical protein